MKFYDCTTAPSPRRVRIFLAEKGITVPTIQVDLRNGEQFSPAFRAINPECTVPVLELDNETRIAKLASSCGTAKDKHLLTFIMRRSRGGVQRLNCSPKMKRDGSRRTLRSCLSY